MADLAKMISELLNSDGSFRSREEEEYDNLVRQFRGEQQGVQNSYDLARLESEALPSESEGDLFPGMLPDPASVNFDRLAGPINARPEERDGYERRASEERRKFLDSDAQNRFRTGLDRLLGVGEDLGNRFSTGLNRIVEMLPEGTVSNATPGREWDNSPRPRSNESIGSGVEYIVDDLANRFKTGLQEFQDDPVALVELLLNPTQALPRRALEARGRQEQLDAEDRRAADIQARRAEKLSKEEAEKVTARQGRTAETAALSQSNVYTGDSTGVYREDGSKLDANNMRGGSFSKVSGQSETTRLADSIRKSRPDITPDVANMLADSLTRQRSRAFDLERTPGMEQTSAGLYQNAEEMLRGLATGGNKGSQRESVMQLLTESIKSSNRDKQERLRYTMAALRAQGLPEEAIRMLMQQMETEE